MVTVAVPLFAAESSAVTVNMPAVLPAVYRPPVVIVPPVADQVTANPVLSAAVNCCVVPADNVTEDGLTVIPAPEPPLTVMLLLALYRVPVVASLACTWIR